MANPLEERFQRSWVEHLARLREVESAHADAAVEDAELRFSVPRIVCIGEESSGKSSTLERMAKMEIFPRAEKLCTRVPIELRLRHRAEETLPEEFRETGYVLCRMIPGATSKLDADTSEKMHPSDVPECVENWMHALVRAANDDVTGVTDDRIVIELYSSMCVNLDLIDLPGIVAGSIAGEPADMMDRTRDLSSSFVADAANPHTFIIAVASARDARIRNSQAMELVQRHNKVQFTIGALTMADLSADARREQPYSQLIDRLTNKSDDTPELGLGYFALKNRDTVVRDVSLEDANQDEKEWFRQHLPEHTDLCGIDNLVGRLVEKLEEYTRGPWVHAEMHRLESQRVGATFALHTLGTFIPSSLKDLVEFYADVASDYSQPSFTSVSELVETYEPVDAAHRTGLENASQEWTFADVSAFADPPDNHIRSVMPGTTPADAFLYLVSNSRENRKEINKKLRCARVYDASMWNVALDSTVFGNSVPTKWKRQGITSKQLFERSDGEFRITGDTHTLLNQLCSQGNLVFVGRKIDKTGSVLGFFYTRDTPQRSSGYLNKACHELMNIVKPGSANELSPNTQSPPSPFVFSAQPDDVFVLSLERKRKLKNPESCVLDVEEFYDDIVVARQHAIDVFCANCRAVFESVAKSFLSSLHAKDARFSAFLEIVEIALRNWSDTRTEACKAKFGSLLDTWKVFKNYDHWFQIRAEDFFTNRLTTAMRELIFFEYADHPIGEMFSTKSDALEEYILTQCDQRGLSEASVIVEHCAEKRRALLRKLEALTNMKNALHLTFRATEEQAPAESTDAPTEEPSRDGNSPHALSHSLSRTHI